MHHNDGRGDPILFENPVYRRRKAPVLLGRDLDIKVRIGRCVFRPNVQLILGDQRFKFGGIGARWDTYDLDVVVEDPGILREDMEC